MGNDVIAKIRAASPFPWSQVVFPNGVVQLRDSNGNEVPLFHMTEFLVLVTNVMSANKEAAPA